MITITRSLARQLRAVFNRAGIRKAGYGPAACVQFVAGPDGLRIRSQTAGVAIEYHQPGKLDTEELSAPLDLLVQCEGRSNDPVTLEAGRKGRVTASWADHGVPQLLDLDGASERANAEFPALPESLVSCPPELLQALRHALLATDQGSPRYALGCLQLRGNGGRIVATDGHQLLVQSGFQFPWTEDVLVPGSGVFACRELPDDQPIAVGLTKDRITFIIGSWAISLAIEKEGRFPKVEDILRNPAQATSRLSISQADAEFLEHALPRLPCDDQLHYPVTLDLNGQVAVRGRPESGPPTELVLTGSRLQGEPVAINVNREYVGRALKLGFREFCFLGPEAAIFCDDGQRQYLWMPLEPADLIRASANTVRIESPAPAAAEAGVSIHPPAPKRRRFTVTPAPTETNGDSSPRARRAANKPASGETSNSPIAQAVALRASLRETLTQTGELIRALKRQKRQTKLVASTLASLKELQKVAG